MDYGYGSQSGDGRSTPKMCGLIQGRSFSVYNK